MIRFFPYRRLYRFLQNETFEPTLSWGLRMAVAAIIPVLWGSATGNMEAAIWITLTAECICWVELKGSFAQSVRVLFFGTVLAVFSAILGSVTGAYLWLSVGCMVVVGFFSGLFKNLGDRGSGLAICVVVLFILSNAFPTQTMQELRDRIFLTGLGGIWTLLVSVVASLLIPVQEPYRRTIALIWKANAALVHEVAKGWDGKNLRSSVKDIYEREKEVRTAIDASFQFYEKMADQMQAAEHEDYHLAHLRKATALIATHIQAISEELENIKIRDVELPLRTKLSNTFRALENVFDRMAVYIMLRTSAEELLLASRISRFNKHLALLKHYDIADDQYHSAHFARVVQLLERAMKLLESSVYRLQEVEEAPVFRTYSLVKTMLILHPKHWLHNTTLLFDFNRFTTRYAVRSAVAAGLAMFLYKWLEIDRGYWIAFTVLIVIQPYFGATLQKAIDRVAGTVAGGIFGGLLIRLPANMYVQEAMLFVCLVCMVYFIRRRYSVAAFFITVSLVLLFDVGEDINPDLIVIRALATLCGASLGIVAGFALLPTWDRQWLPMHITNAVYSNFQYFNNTFFSKDNHADWTKFKRTSESKNSIAFDSFNRYMQEPAIQRRPYSVFYQMITHNVRITRELNNIHLELEGRTDNVEKEHPAQQEQLEACLFWFQENIRLAEKINKELGRSSRPIFPSGHTSLRLSSHQMLYLDKLLFELKALYHALTALKEQGLEA